MPEDQALSLVRDFLAEQGIALKVGAAEFLRRYRDKDDLREVVAAVQEVTNDVDAALEPQTQFQTVVEQLFSGGKHLRFGAKGGARSSLTIETDSQQIPLGSLSSGEKQLLRLLLEVLAAGENTVLIDEPELSLHVDWQQVLVKSMQLINPSCQLILATHSPEVMRRSLTSMCSSCDKVATNGRGIRASRTDRQQEPLDNRRGPNLRQGLCRSFGGCFDCNQRKTVQHSTD